MVEWKMCKLERRLSRRARDERFVGSGASHGRDVGPVAQIRHDDDLLDTGNALRDFGDDPERVDLLRCVTITVGAEQHARLDLTKSIEDALHAEVGGARGPDRAQAGGGEHRDRRLWNIWHEAGHSITGRDA